MTTTRRPTRCSSSSRARNTSCASTPPRTRTRSRGRSGRRWGCPPTSRSPPRGRNPPPSREARSARARPRRRGGPVRVVIAPDSFKGSIGAAAAAAALAEGWRSVRSRDELVRVPLADGGEGTLDVLAAAVSGARWHQERVTGPGGQPVDSAWLELPGGVAAVELARASGLPLLARPDPLGAHTTGLGEVIGRALDTWARHVTIALD